MRPELLPRAPTGVLRKGGFCGYLQALRERGAGALWEQSRRGPVSRLTGKVRREGEVLHWDSRTFEF